MSQAQLQHGDGQHSTSQPIQNMYELPQELSNAQLSATACLEQLFKRLTDPSSNYYARYGAWIQQHPDLQKFCFRCIRPQVWAFLQGRWTLDGLKAIGGDIRTEGRGVYLNGVLGLDRKVRVYVGQAVSLRQRIGQHLNFRYRRDNPSLHYHAMQQSIYNSIGLLAVLPPLNAAGASLPGMDSPELLLNVLEMWMCLVFRTLPQQTLDLWLGEDKLDKESHGKIEKENAFGGLNLANPLDHGAKQREWVELTETDDPLVNEYLILATKGKAALTQTVKREPNETLQDTPAQRRKQYAEAARKFKPGGDNVIQVPQWVLLGGLVVAMGFVWYSASARSQPKPRIRFMR